MTIDEVIAEMTNNADRFKKLSEDYGDSFRHMEVLSDLENAVFYEKQEAKYRQIAAWLEELKVIREQKAGYNMAISDFVKSMMKESKFVKCMASGDIYQAVRVDMIKQIAKRLMNGDEMQRGYDLKEAINGIAEQLMTI